MKSASILILSFVCLTASCTNQNSVPLPADHFPNAAKLCGIDVVAHARHLAVTGEGERIISGNAVRACALPDAAAIKQACQAADTIVTEDPEHPRDDRKSTYNMPEFTVSNARCAFLSSWHQDASCEFDITDGTRNRRVSASRFTHNFLDLSDDIAHDYWVTLWRTEQSCFSKE